MSQRDAATAEFVAANRDLHDMLCGLQFQYIASGVVGILRAWLAQGCPISAQVAASATARFIGSNNSDMLLANIEMALSAQ